jgi:hypothetical protein
MDEAILVFFEDDESGYIAIIYKVFIDDSADREQKKYVIAGALVGSKDSWHNFGKRWKKALSKRPAIGHFHTKEWDRLSGEFEQFTDRSKWPQSIRRDVADAKRDTLVKVVESASIVAIGIGILIPDYKKIRDEHPEAGGYYPEDAFECALQEIFLQAVNAIRKRDTNPRIAFISDLCVKSPRYTEVFSGWKKRNPDSAKYVLGIAHLDDKKIRGCKLPTSAPTM